MYIHLYVNSFQVPHSMNIMFFCAPYHSTQSICILAYFRRVLGVLYHLALLRVDLINLYAFAGLSQMTFLLTRLLSF